MDEQRIRAILAETAKMLSSRNLRLCSNFDQVTRGDWHVECNEDECATARQKAMGEALFEMSLAEKRSQGSEGPPHRTPDFFSSQSTGDSTACDRNLRHGDRRAIAESYTVA